jgi:hypothetical protein
MRQVLVLGVLLMAQLFFAQSVTFSNKLWKKSVQKAFDKADFSAISPILITRECIIAMPISDDLRSRFFESHNSNFSSERNLFEKQITYHSKFWIKNKSSKITEMRILPSEEGVFFTIFIQLKAHGSNYMIKFPRCFLHNHQYFTTGDIELFKQ